MVLREMYMFGISIVQHICEGGGLMSYMAMYMDTIPKLLNHLLFGLGICNIFLLFLSMSSSSGAEIMFVSIHGFFIAFLLCSQTACVWRILNSHPGGGSGGPAVVTASMDPFSNMLWMSPSEFVLGVALGITIGGAILAFVLSRYFGQLSTACEKEQAWISKQQQQQQQQQQPPTTLTNSTIPTKQPVAAASVVVVHSILQKCTEYQGTVLGIWFWSGMVFWFNLAIAILIAMGRQELASGYSPLGQQYETIDPDDNNTMNRSSNGGPPQLFPRYQQQQPQQQQQVQQQPSYAGNYPSVPEVRPPHSSSSTSTPGAVNSSWDSATDPLSSHQHSRPANN